MRHESIDRTPLSLPTTTPTPTPTRTSGPKWSNTRLKIHTNSSKNPQSHRFYSPFTLPDHPTTSPDTARIKRRLFSITPAPRKKKTTELSTPRIFRIAGGQECTQPLLSNNSSVKKAPGNGVLTGQIARAERNAALNVRLLKRLLNTCELDVVELQRVAERGLVLRLVGVDEDVLLVEPVGDVGEGRQFLVVVPIGFDANVGQALMPILLFVPEPWSPVQVDQTTGSSPGVLIIPFRLEILTEEDVETILKHCKVNAGLRSWLKVGEEYGSQYRVPETQELLEDTQHRGKRIEPSEVVVVKALSKVSPHSMSVSIQVQIDMHLKKLGMAIVHDEVGERAVYACSNSDTLETSAPQKLIDVRICPQRIPVETIMGLLSTESSRHVPEGIHRLPRASSLPVITKNKQ